MTERTEATRLDLPIARQTAWRQAVVALTLLTALALWPMHPAVIAMVKLWWNSVTFNHALLLVPLIGWLVWQRRDALAQLHPTPYLPGLAAIAAAAGVWLLGRVADVMAVQQFGFIFMLQAITLTVLGLHVARALLFPLFFLIFLVPFGEALIPPLRDLTAVFVVKGLQLVGVPVFSDGVLLMTPSGNFTVAEACSGIRYLISTVVLASLFANVCFTSWRRRAAVLALAAVVPIFANGVRAFGIVYIAYLTDNEYATGVDHIIYGWVFLAIVTMAVLALGMTFSDRPTDAPAVDLAPILASAPRPVPMVAMVQAALAGATVMALAAVYADRILERAPAQTLSAFATFDPGLPWRPLPQPADDWHPRYAGVDAERLEQFTDGANIVSLYRGRYNRQGRGREMVAYLNSAAAPLDVWSWSTGTTRRVAWGGGTLTASVIQINSERGAARELWQVYWVGGRTTTSDLAAKGLTALSMLTGGEPAAGTVIISAPRRHAGESIDEVLAAFARHLPPPGILLSAASDGG